MPEYLFTSRLPSSWTEPVANKYITAITIELSAVYANI